MNDKHYIKGQAIKYYPLYNQKNIPIPPIDRFLGNINHLELKNPHLPLYYPDNQYLYTYLTN